MDRAPSHRDQLRLEPMEGERAPSSAVERAVVGLAALALIAGVVIAFGNLFGGDSETSSVESSPIASGRADESPTPRPSRTPRPLREIALQPGEPPPHTAPSPVFSGWIRAETDLIVRSQPELTARERGVLPMGQVAYADELPDQAPGDLGWLQIQSPQPSGWIATAEGGSSLVHRYGQPSVPVSGDIWTVAAGRNGFLATGWSAGISDQNLGPMAAVSSDGATWRAAEAPPGSAAWGVSSVAWGPSGWLAVASSEESGRPPVWIWRSPDGLSWSLLGAMEDFPGYAYPTQLVASDRGYLLAVSTGGGPVMTLWFSSDGVTWHESADPGIQPDYWFRVAATPQGFHVWDESPAGRQGNAAFSVDGRSWSVVNSGPLGPGLQIVSVGDRLLAIDTDPTTGSPRVWSGAIEGARLTWRRQQKAEAEFEGAAYSTLASDGRRAVAFGWGLLTEEPLVWTGDGSTWTRSSLPAEAFGGIPRLAAGGPPGLVVVGYRPTMRGPNPVFWRETDDGSWQPERTPIVDVAADPLDAECGEVLDEAIDFVVLDRALAVACFGAEPLTFRAWSAACDGCYGGGGGTWEPAWLVSPQLNQLYLSPIEDDSGRWAQAVIDPSLGYGQPWARQWVEVTGHFDDPAAASCRWTPNPDELWYYSGRRAIVDGCRQQFVLTAISVVGAP